MHIPGNTAERALRQRAYILAESGRYASVHAVEQALIGEGWANAGRQFQDGYLRKAVAERCTVAAH
jgi:hypothetical protein